MGSVPGKQGRKVSKNEGRTDLSWIFLFEPPDSSRILSPAFFSSFLWE